MTLQRSDDEIFIIGVRHVLIGKSTQKLYSQLACHTPFFIPGVTRPEDGITITPDIASQVCGPLFRTELDDHFDIYASNGYNIVAFRNPQASPVAFPSNGASMKWKGNHMLAEGRTNGRKFSARIYPDGNTELLWFDGPTDILTYGKVKP